MPLMGMNRKKFCCTGIKLLLVFILLFWNIGFILPVLVPDFPFLSGLVPFLHGPYSAVCHQDPAHTFSSHSILLLVCARCSGIYFGALIASMVLAFSPTLKRKPSLNFLFIPFIILLIHVLVSLTGIFPYSKETAFITGFLAGGATLYFLGQYLIVYYVNR